MIDSWAVTAARFIATAVLPVLLFSSPAAAQLTDQRPEWYMRSSDDCFLFVQEYGRGKDVVVVLHGGWGAEHSYLLDAVQGLEDRYRFVFYDQRGSLRSPCPPSAVTVAKHVEDLERLRERLGLQRITLFAHSMGTTLAMAYLDRHPHHVRGMTLVGASAPRPPTTEAEKELAERQAEAKEAFINRPEVEEELRRHSLDRPSEDLTDRERSYAFRIRLAGAHIFHVDRWQEVKGGIAYFNTESGKAATASMPGDYDFIPALAAHPCPIWIIEGDHDFGPLTVDYHRLWSADLPNVRMEIIPEAGHNVWIDAPDLFQRTLARALESTTDCERVSVHH